VLGEKRAQPQSSAMGNRVFEQSIVIREQHLDTFGHVNNARYLEIFEQARWDLITDNGFGLDFVKSSGTGPVILEINLRFVRELKNRQQLLIRSFVDSYEGKIGRMTQLLIDDAGEICCEGKFVFAQWDTRSRKIIAPTPEWRAAVGLE
jgi:acyl-CoA thioester hydrolase